MGIQMLLAVPVLHYHRGVAHMSLLAGLAGLWFTVALCLALPDSERFKRLLRVSFAFTLAAVPFAWYDLHFHHGCRITVEDSPILLAVILAGPPIIFRNKLGRSLVSDSAPIPQCHSDSQLDHIHRMHLAFWAVLLNCWLAFEVWLPQMERGRFELEAALLVSGMLLLWLFAFLCPRVGVVAMFNRSKLPPHLTAGLVGLAASLMIWGL
jgi:hypothetical protein